MNCMVDSVFIVVSSHLSPSRRARIENVQAKSPPLSEPLFHLFFGVSGKVHKRKWLCWQHQHYKRQNYLWKVAKESSKQNFTWVGEHNYCRNPDNSSAVWCCSSYPERELYPVSFCTGASNVSTRQGNNQSKIPFNPYFCFRISFPWRGEWSVKGQPIDHHL